MMQWRTIASAVVIGVTTSGMAIAQSSSSNTSTDSSAPTPATTSPSGARKTHIIEVGPIGRHSFKPDITTAEKGDLIIFEMLPKNHSVVFMDKDSPCVPFHMAKPSLPYLQPEWSGYYPLPDDISPVPYRDRTFNITLESTDPIFYFCSAPGSCKDFQMIGAINPANAADLKSAKYLASQASYSLSPLDPIPDESTTAGNSQTSPAPTSSTSNSDSNSSGGSSSLSSGAIAGIVIGAVAAFALVGLLFFLVGRKRESDASATAVTDAKPHDPESMEHPAPPYDQQQRYSMQPPGSPGLWNPLQQHYEPPHGGVKVDSTGRMSMMSAGGETMVDRNPHRLSELPSQNYDPVEIYTPGLPEHNEIPTPTSPHPMPGSSEGVRDMRRDTMG